MNFIEKRLENIDEFQRKHRFASFIFAVNKKYSEDQGGQRTALLAYYAFWSLFPLLIILTTVTQVILASHLGLRHKISVSVENYFPILGNRLEQNIRIRGKSGATLILSLILTLYGARGGAESFRYSLNHSWHIPLKRRLGFPKNLLKDLALIVWGGTGLLATSIIAGFAADGSHLLTFRLLSAIVTIVLLFGVFVYLTKASLPKTFSFKDLFIGAAVSSIGLTLLQLIGGFVINHELRNLNDLYGSFALALGVLFWLALEAQVIIYAIEINVVYVQRLWPRSLLNSKPTKADQIVKETMINQINY